MWQLYPTLPEPAETRIHRWRYSQVHHAAKAKPGDLQEGARVCGQGEQVEAVVVCEKPLIVLAGDGFTESNFEGCYRSAAAVS